MLGQKPTKRLSKILKAQKAQAQKDAKQAKQYGHFALLPAVATCCVPVVYCAPLTADRQSGSASTARARAFLTLPTGAASLWRVLLRSKRPCA